MGVKAKDLETTQRHTACWSKTKISTHALIRSHRLHLPSAAGITVVRQAHFLLLRTLYNMQLREAEYVGQTAGVPCAPQLGTASAELSMALAARAPTELPSPRHATECLFCPAPPAACTYPSTYDGAGLSDIDMGNGKSIQVTYRYSVPRPRHHHQRRLKLRT
jgi:hypothetical protein